jgi:hypothetical protein
MENLISARGRAEDEYQKEEEENEEDMYEKKSSRKQIDMSRLDNLEEVSFASIKSLIKKK